VNGFGGRVDKVEASLPNARRGGLDRLVKALGSSPSSHRIAMWKLRAHPAWVASRRHVPAYELQDVEYGLARMPLDALYDYALRYGEYLLSELAAHERDEPACDLCRRMK
jgi:hypothetical protein